MSNSKKVYAQISKVLRKARLEKGMTQEGLAAASGVSATYIGFIEQGLKKPTVETICKLTGALDVSLEKQVFKGF
jgi:transcriptional regulator with XRE-family HTH domain